LSSSSCGCIARHASRRRHRDHSRIDAGCPGAIPSELHLKQLISDRKKPPHQSTNEAKWRAQQEKQRKEQAIANATGIRILAAISAAVPVRLMKRDLFFVVERLAALLDEKRLAVYPRS
jgi:hypothetical protein